MTKFLKFLILLDESEFRLLTAQDSAVAVGNFCKAKVMNWMDSIRDACSFPNSFCY